MIGYTPTPDYYNDYIAHYGIKGMKWGKRKSRIKGQVLELRARLNRKLRGIDPNQITTNHGKEKVRAIRNANGSNLSKGLIAGRKRAGIATNTRGQTTKWEPETRSERQSYTYSKTVNDPELKKKAPEGVSIHGGKNGGYAKYNTNAQNFLGADYNDVKKGVYGRHSSNDWESDIGLRSPNNPANKKKKKKK